MGLEYSYLRESAGQVDFDPCEVYRGARLSLYLSPLERWFDNNLLAHPH